MQLSHNITGSTNAPASGQAPNDSPWPGPPSPSADPPRPPSSQNVSTNAPASGQYLWPGPPSPSADPPRPPSSQNVSTNAPASGQYLWPGPPSPSADPPRLPFSQNVSTYAPASGQYLWDIIHAPGPRQYAIPSPSAEPPRLHHSQNGSANAPALGQYQVALYHAATMHAALQWESVLAPGPRQYATPTLSAYLAYSQGSMNSLQQQYQVMSPSPSAPLAPGPAAARAPTQLDDLPPDHWHSNKCLMSINFGEKNQYPYRISFKPASGPCNYGVALLNLEIGRGMQAPNEPIGEYLPLHTTRYANASFLIDWPGYGTQSWVLNLIDPRTHRYVTRAQLGAQATQHFKDFINTRTQEHFSEGNGIELGIDGVMYDQVRLSELYTKDGGRDEAKSLYLVPFQQYDRFDLVLIEADRIGCVDVAAAGYPLLRPIEHEAALVSSSRCRVVMVLGLGCDAGMSSVEYGLLMSGDTWLSDACSNHTSVVWRLLYLVRLSLDKLLIDTNNQSLYILNHFTSRLGTHTGPQALNIL
ncbi:hypothetical protein GGX14DRAFT_402440 [Mycena pura]|uniref:Uncharacterized protein n=1 Tax=Mycena pura TaxID=153505 RepID=A0AAD6V2C2_9AGAR|nr:hypothetical protein GGX14DRAFT_402440 [Mycena pura]